MKLLNQYILAALLLSCNALYHCRCFIPLSINFSGLVRLIGPVLLFLFLEQPIAFTITSGILDSIEPNVNRTSLPYQLRDKIFDLWGYVVSYIFLIVFKPSIMMPYFSLLTFLFIIRVIGNLSFIYSKNRKMLFFFPNWYEIAFIFLPFCDVVPFLRKNKFYYFGILCVLKLLMEFIMHYVPVKYKSREYIIKKYKFLEILCPGKIKMLKESQTGITNASNLNTPIPLFEF